MTEAFFLTYGFEPMTRIFSIIKSYFGIFLFFYGEMVTISSNDKTFSQIKEESETGGGVR